MILRRRSGCARVQSDMRRLAQRWRRPYPAWREACPFPVQSQGGARETTTGHHRILQPLLDELVRPKATVSILQNFHDC